MILSLILETVSDIVLVTVSNMGDSVVLIAVSNNGDSAFILVTV